LTSGFGKFPKLLRLYSTKFFVAISQRFFGIALGSTGNFLLSQAVLGIFASSGRQV
jgi:hypothetical protein